MMIGRYIAVAAVALGLGSATAAYAKKPAPPPPPAPQLCALSDIGPAASACEGWISGNLNGGSPAKKTSSASALNTLLGVSTFTKSNITWLEDISASGSSVDFDTPLFGDTIVSFHVGGANGDSDGVGAESTAFYEFDAGNIVGGLDTITFNVAGLSNARLYSTGAFVPCTRDCGPPPPGVPEPASWALLITGFGLAGSALRRRSLQQRA